jgi:hypothetical protein
MKTMKKYIEIILMGMLTFSISACSDILDKTPLTEISEDDLWNDPSLVKAYVNSVYNQVGHGWTESMLSSACDETELTWLRGCELTNFSRISPSDLGRMNGGWWGWDNRGWSTKWTNIAKANIILERIDEVPFTDESMRARLKGEVKFLRVFEYNDLITRWGGVPIITQSFTIADDAIIRDQKRASYQECVDFMVGELDDIIKNNMLPDTYSGDDYGRATRIAAMALKSKILLFAASDLMNVDVQMPEIGYTTPKSDRWQIAATAATEALNAALQAGYSLYKSTGDPEQDYQKLFLDNTSANKEVIFARMGTSSALGDNLSSVEQYNFPNGYGGWGGNCPLQELVDDYEIVENGVARAFDWNNPKDAASPYENRDPRFYASILYDGAAWKDRNVETYFDVDASGQEIGGGRDSRYGNDNWNASPTGYNMKKFMDESYVGNTWDFSAKNWIWLRVAELYLNQAEALYHTGDENGAREALRPVRERAGMPAITASGTQLLEAIKHERRIEFAFEEHRYFDVRRWKEGPQNLGRTVHSIYISKHPDGHKTYKVSSLRSDIGGERIFDSKIYWCPILKSEIDKNPNLTQNPGYTN